ncbi:hypothetical protein [Acidovorax sp. Root217]|uniref:hypothetical protein n=1 Tax=Acidovorax sp. Root217 TaxID=1736492 RepID=UPI000708D82C|nr:hypothetical protein [Acidovorax sp. Root217]KRC30671.1 hypothetical protein ASE31_00340 [Acidovorax sp. Root217]
MSHDQPTVNPYRKVSTATWSDRKVLNLTPLQPSGQALFLMLMVGPQSTHIPGVQPVGRLAFAEMLGWEVEAFDEAFSEAYREGLAKADWKARLIFVPNAIKHNLPQSPNVVKSWGSMWARVPECDLKTEVWTALHDALSALGQGFVDAFKSACPLKISESEQQIGEPTGKAAGKATGKPSAKPTGKPTDNQEAVSSKQEVIPDPTGSSSALPPDSAAPVNVSAEPGQQGLDGIEPASEEGGPKASAQVPPCPYNRLLDAYAHALPTLPQPRRSLFVGGKNAAAMRQRWAWVMTADAETGENAGQRMATTTEQGVAWFRRFFEYVGQAPFLLGTKGGERKWTADIGWLMTLGNFEKVLAGNYHADAQEVSHA